MRFSMNRSMHGRSSRLGAAVLLLATFGLAGCDIDSLVELPDPDLITLPTVQDPANVSAVLNGALFEFARAMSGVATNNATPGLVGISGVMSDEMWYSSTFSTMREIDRRVMFDTNGDVNAVYSFLHRARNLAEEAESLLAASEQSASAERGRMLALSGFVYVFFAENWCSNVPFSSAPLGEQLIFRPAIGTDAMLDSAIVRFDAVINGDVPTNAEFTNLARVGKARALQNKGDLAGAAAVAADVPDDFEYVVEYNDDNAGQNNGFWYNVNSEGRSSVATDEGTNGIHFFDRGEGTDTLNMTPDPVLTIDPRAPVDSGFGGTADRVRYVQFKYPDRGADIPIASGIEARLIEAEADLDFGANPGSAVAGNWLAILNDLRADNGVAGTLTDPGTPRDRVELLYQERAFWMWLTAHRLGDLRRLVRLPGYGYDVDTVYPIGNTIRNESRGNAVSFIVPNDEANNPEYTDACDVETP